jgi:hypothetical protein
MRTWTRFAGVVLLVVSALPTASRADRSVAEAGSAERVMSHPAVPAVAAAEPGAEDDPSVGRYKLKLDCNDSGTATTAWLYDGGGNLIGTTVIRGLCYTGTVDL